MPSWPSVFRPHASTVPSSSTARVWPNPAAIELAPFRPATAAGENTFGKIGSQTGRPLQYGGATRVAATPSSPYVSRPQAIAPFVADADGAATMIDSTAARRAPVRGP